MNTLEYKGRSIKIERVAALFRHSQQTHWYAQIDGQEVSKSSFRSRKAAIARAKEKIDAQEPGVQAMQVSYKILQMVGDRIVVTNPTDIVAWAQANNRVILGLNINRAQRAELQGQPRIKGFCGPMYDGDVDGVAVIRYEDAESNDILSR